MPESTENLILDAARKHFMEKGYAAARMQEIADTAGINKALLHYYFRSKEKLFQHILKETVDILEPRLAGALSKEGTVLEKIEGIVESYISTMLEHPYMPMFVMTELSQKRENFIKLIKSRAQQGGINFQTFFMQVMQEMQEGKIRKMNPIHLVLNVISMCIFPFIVRPIFSNVVELPQEQYDELLKTRKAEVMDFIQHALKV